jgi:hypothetical protein
MAKLRQLTEQEYFDLQAQYDKTPAPEDAVGATGEPYRLGYMLRNMGFSVPTHRADSVKLADRILSTGYQR